MSSNWSKIRGAKIKKTEKQKKFNFELIEKKILTITKSELDRLTHENMIFPNKYSSWVVK